MPLAISDLQLSIEQSVQECVRAAQFLTTEQSKLFIEQSALAIADCIQQGGKVLIAGNGGSLCDAMHFAEEMTAQFRNPRKALPAIALADSGHMSCVANDFGYEKVFSRGVEALGSSNDILVVLTTSGNSGNLLHAVRAAKEKKMKVIGFLGKSGGELKGQCDLELLVSGFPYSDRIQEAHMAAIHIIVEAVEKIIFEN